MTGRTIVSHDLVVDAPADAVWNAVTDWEEQETWMLGTTTRAYGPQGVGQELAAFTGMRTLGVLDTMRVIEWDPPRRCVVEHTGTVLRGLGVVEVEPLDEETSRLHWREELDLPYGVVGRVGWPAVRPAFLAGVRLSLQRLARQVEDRTVKSAES
jgi:carbon monoxide dehydrogenase subunit G